MHTRSNCTPGTKGRPGMAHFTTHIHGVGPDRMACFVIRNTHPFRPRVARQRPYNRPPLCTGGATNPLRPELSSLLPSPVEDGGGQPVYVCGHRGCRLQGGGLPGPCASRQNPQGEKEARRTVSPSCRARRVGKRHKRLRPQGQSTGSQGGAGGGGPKACNLTASAQTNKQNRRALFDDDDDDYGYGFRQFVNDGDAADDGL